MINLYYHAFFTVNVLHDYFTNKLCSDLEVVPSADCQSLFSGLNVQWRIKDNEFRTFIKVNDVGGPFINNPLNAPPDDKVYRLMYGKDIFRLYLKLKKNSFGNYTNISPAPGKKYYFSNRTGNAKAGVFYASRTLPDHANGIAYLPGDLVQEPPPAAPNVFEALTKHTSAAPGDLVNTNLWAPLTAAAYTTSADQVDYSGGLYAFTLPAAVSIAEVRIFGFDFNTVTPGYTIAIGETETQYFKTGEERDTISVRLSHLPPGRYKITVNATSKEVYYDPALNEDGMFGVIEIFNHLPATDPFALLDANEIVQPKKYTISFPARRVLWKYTRKDNRAQAITDTGPGAYIFTLHTNDFVSQKPIPLAEAALTTLELTFSTADQKLAPLPNPPAAKLGRFNQAGYDYLCTEMYLNY
jgi:hypothetical protein